MSTRDDARPPSLAQEEAERTSRPAVLLGLAVAPGLAQEVTAQVASDLEADLATLYGEVAWRTELVVDRVVVPPAPTTEIFDAARRTLLTGNWDLGIVVTDLPLRVERRAVSTHLSRTHGIAVVSLPALGPVRLRHRLRRALVQLVGALIDDRGEDGQLALRERATGASDRLLVPAVVSGNVRLLLGMVRANRPWRFAARLYRALVAALAAGAFGVVSADLWRLSGTMGWPRLTLMCLVAVVLPVVVVIAAHGLWERAPDPRVREQVVLFNAATTATVALGILVLYAELFALVLAGAAVVVTPETLGEALGRDARLADYVRLAWFVASFATIGGALGAALESDEAIRQAAYAVAAPEDEPG